MTNACQVGIKKLNLLQQFVFHHFSVNQSGTNAGNLRHSSSGSGFQRLVVTSHPEMAIFYPAGEMQFGSSYSGAALRLLGLLVDLINLANSTSGDFAEFKIGRGLRVFPLDNAFCRKRFGG